MRKLWGVVCFCRTCLLGKWNFCFRRLKFNQNCPNLRIIDLRDLTFGQTLDDGWRNNKKQRNQGKESAISLNRRNRLCILTIFENRSHDCCCNHLETQQMRENTDIYFYNQSNSLFIFHRKARKLCILQILQFIFNNALMHAEQ